MNKIKKVEKKKTKNKKDNNNTKQNEIDNENENENKIVLRRKKPYRFLSEKEVIDREYKYDLCLFGVGESVMLVNEALLEYTHFMNRKITEQFEWQDYLLCDGLPNVQSPKELRTYFLQLRMEEDRYFKNIIHWVFSINEKSILTQNPERKDYTRRKLIQSRPNFGEFFNQHINNYLKIISRIEYFLVNGIHVMNTEPHVVKELMLIKVEAENEIFDIFDRLTYQILTAYKIYMDEINTKTSEFFYKGEDFAIQIWSLNNVPIIFKDHEPPSFLANFHQLKTTVHIPFSILEDNLTLRGIHFNLDFLSDKTKSYSFKIMSPLMRISVHLFDAFENLIYEWELKKDIEYETISKLKSLRKSWENQKAAEEEAEREKRRLDRKKSTGELIVDEQKRRSRESKEKIKRPLVQKPPQMILEDQVPDIKNEFFKREQNAIDSFFNDNFHPDLLELNENEINLRHYSILGGIYSFNFVEKPVFVNLDHYSLNFSIHEGCGRLKMKNVKLVSEDDYVPKNINRKYFETKDFYEDEENPLFVLTFDLPVELCNWNIPIPCHHESNITGYIYETPPPPPPTSAEPNPKDKTKKSIVAPNYNIRSSLIAMTKKLGSPNVPKAITRLSSITSADTHRFSNYSEYFNPSTYSGSPSTIRNSRRISEITKRLSSNSTGISLDYSDFDVDGTLLTLTNRFNILFTNDADAYDRKKTYKNFNLKEPITYDQICDIKQLCMPRILSSHTFPREIYENEMAAYEEKIKYFKNNFSGVSRKKKMLIEKPKSLDERNYSLMEQHNPERLFPIFDKTKRLNFMDNEFDTSLDAKPTNFYDLLNSLNNVKSGYSLRIKSLMDAKSMHWNTLRKFVIAMKVFRKNLEHNTETENNTKFETHSRPNPSQQLQRRRNTKRQFSIASKMLKSDSDTSLEYKIDKHSPGIIYVQEDYDLRNSVNSKTSDSVVHNEQPFTEYDKSEYNYEMTTDNENVKTYQYSHWTTEHIKKTLFDKENHRITIYTDRLGTFGLAYDNYIHFPFTSWDIQPSPNDPLEVIVTVETRFVKCVFFVNKDGYRGYVTNLNETPSITKNINYYIQIENPINDLNILKKLFREKSINIFPEIDAHYYIKRDYYCLKHFATENLAYYSIALNSNFIKFRCSLWNRLAKRREVILAIAQNGPIIKPMDTKTKNPTEDMHLVLLSPTDATFITVHELCSDNLDVINLKITKTWRNLDFYADLNHLIVSLVPDANDLRLKNPYLISLVKNLLTAIKPLSYS